MPRHTRYQAVPLAYARPSRRPAHARRLTFATAAALALLAAIPLAAPTSRVNELVGPGPVDAAPPSATASPAPPGAVAADPGPDDRRSVLDAARPAHPATLTGYRWPLPRGRLTLPFGASPWGSRIVDGERFHDGIDLATFCGDRIVAAHEGVVLAAGRRYDRWMGWRGDLTRYERRLDRKKLWMTLPIVVVIDDGNGYRSVYAHFSKVVVKRGQRVEAGELLGYEGMTGRASGCHLHYGLFSPLERSVFLVDPAVTTKMRLPATQTARVDPLLVLPERPKPKPKPKPSASAAPAPDATAPAD